MKMFKQLPFSNWIDTIVNWLTEHLSGIFSFLQTAENAVMNVTTNTISHSTICYDITSSFTGIFVFKRKIGFPIFILIGLLFIYKQNMWDDLMSTITLVLIQVLFL